jgi:hypothetical protein
MGFSSSVYKQRSEDYIAFKCNGVEQLQLDQWLICEIITFKVEERVFLALYKGHQSFGVQKNHFLK